MAAVPIVISDAVAPAVSLAVDRALLAQARAERRPHLRIYAYAGDVLLRGRFHPNPGSPTAPRRLSGGCAVPAGAGFVQVSIALPHRSALESDDPQALRPEQVLNRAVRGVMGGLEALGVQPYYPGRDLVTVDGRPIGWISLAVEEGGATLVEAGVSVERDLALLGPIADRVDPGGVVPVRLWQPSEVTSVAREQGGTPSPGEVAAAIVEGYRRRLGWEIEERAAPLPEGSGVDGDADEVAGAGGWARRPVMLGVLMAQVALARDGRLGRVRLAGDVIAPAATMTAMEDAVRGAAAERTVLVARLREVLADASNFLLGAHVEDVVDVVLAGATA